jgi:hypothetical protein
MRKGPVHDEHIKLQHVLELQVIKMLNLDKWQPNKNRGCANTSLTELEETREYQGEL